MQDAQNPSATPKNNSRHQHLSRWIIPHSYNIINGHDYTDARFVEVDRTFKDLVVPGLPEIPIVSLFGLTTRIGPAARAGYDGSGWRDVMAVPTPWDRFKWLPISTIVSLMTKYTANRDSMFRVWFCYPGLLHVEVANGGPWTLDDITTLPKWIFMG